MTERFYFRQLLSGLDFAADDPVAEAMVNFVYAFGDRETLQRDPRQRFAHRAEANVVALTQRIRLKLVVGGERAANDVVVNPLIGFISEGFRCVDLAARGRSPRGRAFLHDPICQGVTSQGNAPKL